MLVVLVKQAPTILKLVVTRTRSQNRCIDYPPPLPGILSPSYPGSCALLHPPSPPPSGPGSGPVLLRLLVMLCYLHLDGSCLNIKIRFMGEQLKADCSFLAPQAEEYAPILVLRCQIFGCLNQFARCLWLCECASVCMHEYCMCVWNVEPPTAPVWNHESFDAFGVSVHEQFRR